MPTISDNRVIITNGSSLTLKNTRTKNEEEFIIKSCKGRGGSCIVYEAFNRTQKRRVLLKEFYPLKYFRYLEREKDTLALLFNGEEKKINFCRDREHFLKICDKQLDFYNEHAHDSADELIEIQGEYHLGDTVFVMMSFGDGYSWEDERFRDESLYQIFETSLALLRQLKLYHNNGLLHCDVKPANVYIFNNTRQMVRLLDFGSVLELQEGHLSSEGYEETLSYTREFAAPELLAAKDEENSDNQENYFMAVTPKADLFSFGALLYNRITGSYPSRNRNYPGDYSVNHDKCVESIEKFWNAEKNGRIKNVPEHVQARLIEFLRGLWEKSPDSRFSLEETEEHLESLLKDIAPPKFIISSKCKAPRPNGYFLGREKELAELKNFLTSDKKIIFISGDEGLGKSSLALKLAWEERNNFEFFWITFNEDLQQTLVGLWTEPCYPFDNKNGYDRRGILLLNKSCLSQYGNRTVLIIDNCALSSEKLEEMLKSDTFQELQGMNLKVIFTSKHRLPKESDLIAHLELAPLSAEELCQLTCHYYQAEDPDNCFAQIIRIARYNTLVVEQMAKILQISQQGCEEISPEALLEKIQEGGYENRSVIELLIFLFNLSRCSEIVMAQAALLPVGGMGNRVFLEIHDNEGQGSIRFLILNGWLKKSSNKLILLHPLVRSVGLHFMKQSETSKTGCRKFVEDYCNYYCQDGYYDDTHSPDKQAIDEIVQFTENVKCYLDNSEDLTDKLKEILGLTIQFLSKVDDYDSENQEYAKLLKLAEQGDAVAQYKLGVYCEDKENIVEAVTWYKKSMELGNTEAMIRLAICYSLGRGTHHDEKEAINLMREAAKAGNDKAKFFLAEHYNKVKDYSEAKELYMELAEKGKAEAQYRIALMYKDSFGVPNDDEKAVHWFREAAERDYAPAQYCLGICYYQGDDFLPRDGNEAVKWFKKAAKQGEARAQYELGEFYRKGEIVGKNDEKAKYWYEEAAKQGHKSAQERLSKFYT